jgi:hypothetical protein
LFPENGTLSLGSEPERGVKAFPSGWIDTLVNYFSEENYEF